MAERAQDLPEVSQQGSSPGKDHQVGGPSGQSDSGYYPDSLDQTSPACGQTSKEQTENGAAGGAELCDTGGVKEKQGSVELSRSGGQDLPTEQPRKDEDNTRSFPVIGPRILDNEHVASCAVPVKPPATHNGEVAGEADTKKPQQDSQPPLSCSSTSHAVPDSDMPGAEADLTSLNSSRIVQLSILSRIEKTAYQAKNDLVHQPAEVDPTALHKMLLNTFLQISEDSENLLMATQTSHTPKTPVINVRKGAPCSKNPTEAHTNLPVSSSSHQNLQVGEDNNTENPVQRRTAPNSTEDSLPVGTAPNSTEEQVGTVLNSSEESVHSTEESEQVVTAPKSTEDPVHFGTAPNSTEDSVQVRTAPNSTQDSEQVGTAPKGTDDSESEQVVTAPNSTEDTVQVVTAPKDAEVSVQVGTAPNSTEKQVQMGTAPNSTEDSVQMRTAPNSTEDSVQMVTAHSSTENPIQMVTAPNSTEDSESVQVVTAQNSTEDSVQMGTVPNSTEDLMQVLTALKGTDNSESEQAVTAPKSTEDSVQEVTAPNSTEDSVQVLTAPNSTEDSESEQVVTAPNSTDNTVHVVRAPKSTEEPAHNGVLFDNPENEGHLEDKGKAEVLSNSPVMKSHSKPANKDHCHDAEQKKGRKKESGGIKKRDHGKKVTPTPKQLPPDQAVEEDQDDVTAIKKVLRQNSLTEGQDDATAKEKTLIKVKFEEEDMHEEKGSQPVCLKKPELIIASKKRDEKQKTSTNRKQGFLVQIRGGSSSSHGHHETPPNTKTPKKASIQTWSQKTSFLIALLVQLYAFFKSWIHKEKPPDVKSCKTDTTGIVLEHDVQVYHMQADEDQDTCTPPDPSEHGDDQQTDDHNTPEWLVQEDVEDDDLYLGTDNPTDDSAHSTTVIADPCTEGPEGGQIAIGAVGHSVGSTCQESLPAGGHSSYHLHTALRQDAQAALPFTCALETELLHYRETERGISVTVLDIGGQVLDETQIFAPTAVQQHMIEHIAARAFSAFPMLGFTVRWPGGRPIPLGTWLDPLTAQNIILQMYHADEGDGSWQWRIVEEEVGERSTFAVEANIHQQVSGGGEQREQDWDTSTHGSTGDEGEKVRDDGDKGYLCTICLDTEVDLLVEISCKHCFHQMCLQRWLQWQNKCPVCRTENPQILERES